MNAAAKAPKPLVRFSGGQPNMPRGEPEFVPLNPWGRGFPAPPRPEKPPLYQVVVRDKRDGNKELRVGPQMGHQYAELMRLAIEQQIGLGAERRWSNPTLICVTPEMGKLVI
jgi:hypothetical protein